MMAEYWGPVAGFPTAQLSNFVYNILLYVYLAIPQLVYQQQAMSTLSYRIRTHNPGQSLIPFPFFKERTTLHKHAEETNPVK